MCIKFHFYVSSFLLLLQWEIKSMNPKKENHLVKDFCCSQLPLIVSCKQLYRMK